MLGAIALGAALVAAVGILATVVAFRADPAEREAAMPADALIPDAMFVATQAVTVGDSPWGVWPWLAQMGSGRGGWYSYDWVDNGGRESAQAIIRKFQHPKPGNVFPALPGARGVFVVASVQAPQHLVLTVPDAVRGTRVTWEFLLRSIGDSRSRLVIRGRVARHWLAPYEPAPHGLPPRHLAFIEHVYAMMGHLPGPLLIAIGGFGHRVMQNRQIRGIRRRAEHARRLAGLA